MPLRYEVILTAGVEGGGVVLLGLPKAKGWLFALELNDHTPQLLDEGDSGIHSQTEFVDTWPAALNLIDRYQWETFHPIVVHPEFRKLIYEAYVDRFKARKIDVTGRNGKWEKKCLDMSDKIFYKERQPSELKRSVK